MPSNLINVKSVKNIEYKFEDYPKLFSILESPSNYFNQIQIYKHQKKSKLKSIYMKQTKNNNKTNEKKHQTKKTI